MLDWAAGGGPGIVRTQRLWRQRRFLIARTNCCFFAIACALLVACESTTTVVPEDYSAREVVELARWQVESEGEVLGHVVKYEIRDAKEPVQFFRVTDRDGRWLGEATANGRFTRRTPFDGDQDLGVLAMKSGVALLLEASAPVQMKAVPVEADWQAQPKLKGQR